MEKSSYIISDSKTIGSIIKKIRKEMLVTQEELANYSNLSRIGVLKLEKGADLKLSTLTKILKLLGYELVLRKRVT